MRAQPRPQEHSLAAGLLFCFSQGEQRKNRVLKVPRSPPGSRCTPLAGVTLNIGQSSISKRMKPIGRPALRRLQTGLPPPRAAAKGAYFGRGMAGSLFSKQLYLLGAEMMGVGPFLCPLPHLLAHPCISWCRHSRTPHPPPSQYPLPWLLLSPCACGLAWYLQRMGQFVTGCSGSTWHSEAPVSNLPPGDTDGGCQTRGTEPPTHWGCREEGSLPLQVRINTLKSLGSCVSCCFSQTVHEDVRGGVSVPQSGVRG